MYKDKINLLEGQMAEMCENKAKVNLLEAEMAEMRKKMSELMETKQLA